MQEDAIRWDQRHAQGFMPQEPSTILYTYESLLRTYIAKNRVSALDIACGNGRNAKLLAHLGFSVLGVDISKVAIDSLKGVQGVNALCVDLDHFTIPKESYDVVLNFYFLDRRLFSQIKNGLKRGGIVVFETFCAVGKAYDREIFSELPPHRSLKDGELERAFKGWKILHNTTAPIYRSKPTSGGIAHSGIIESESSLVDRQCVNPNRINEVMSPKNLESCNRFATSTLCLAQTFIAQKP